MLPPDFMDRLKGIVGAEHCRCGPLDLDLYGYDSSPFFCKPEAVAFPGTAAEVAQVVRLAHGARVPLVARGAGTCISGGAVAKHGGLVLSAIRLNHILDFDPLEGTVLAEAGVVNLKLQDWLAPHGYMYPPDPASQRASTIGGNVAENAGGMKGVKYGLTKHYVEGLEVVLADGTVARTGALAEGPDAAGPDLTGLFLASEGTLGFVTRALLRVVPLPRETRTVSAVFDDLAKSGRAVSRIIGDGIIPTAMEIMDHQLVVALEDYLHLGFPLTAEAMLLIEVDGLGPELDRQMGRIQAICRQEGATSIDAAKSAEERDKLWLARRSGNGAMGRIKPAFFIQDVTVPIDRLPGILRFVQGVAQKHDVTIVQMAHAGDGNLHPHLLYTPGDEAEYDRVLAASSDIFDEALAQGGAITGEHGVGLEKIGAMARQFSRDELGFMWSIKKALDPALILNPGKLLPEVTDGMAAAAPRPAPAPRSIEVEPENLLAVAGAEVTAGEVEAALAPHGLYWPVTGLNGHTLADIMGQGLLGAETLARGSMVNWVLGATYATAEGKTVSSGGRTLKNVAGYDYTRLGWRSFGHLAKCAGFILKLIPRPEEAPVLVVPLADLAEGAALARDILLGPVGPDALRLTLAEGRVALVAWLSGFREVVAAKKEALAQALGGRPFQEQGDGFAYWRERPVMAGEGVLRLMGRRAAILGAADKIGRGVVAGVEAADIDVGGGRASLRLAATASPQGTAQALGLVPDVFTPAGVVYERLAKGIGGQKS